MVVMCNANAIAIFDRRRLGLSGARLDIEYDNSSIKIEVINPTWRCKKYLKRSPTPATATAPTYLPWLLVFTYTLITWETWIDSAARIFGYDELFNTITIM